MWVGWPTTRKLTSRLRCLKFSPYYRGLLWSQISCYRHHLFRFSINLSHRFVCGCNFISSSRSNLLSHSLFFTISLIVFYMCLLFKMCTNNFVSALFHTVLHICSTNLTVCPMHASSQMTSNKFECQGVTKSFPTGRLEREMQMVQNFATRCSFIAILWVSLVTFSAITLCGACQQMFTVVLVYFVIDSVRRLMDTPS
jgi:hypothetical protein